jgi:hypothetical protein
MRLGRLTELAARMRPGFGFQESRKIPARRVAGPDPDEVKQFVYQNAAQSAFMIQQLEIEHHAPQANEARGPYRLAARFAGIETSPRGAKATPKAQRYALSVKIGERLLELQ